MATRTYYGTCTTGSAVVQKDVYISDTDIKDDFNFQEGDLLTVFFADTNTVSTPSIVVYNRDTNDEVSIIDDSGKLIKTLDIEANLENAWAAGETVIFAYTQQGISDTYYWELIDANHASVQTYGETKLFDEDELNNLLTGDYNGETDIALTPAALKKFYDLLQGQDDEVPLGLKWTPSEEGTLQNLGTLSLSNNTAGITITYPIEAKIQQYITDHPQVTHTGQLTNNGNGNGVGHETESSEPFITRVVPNNMYFKNGYGLCYGEPGNAKMRFLLNNADNYIVIGDDEDNTLEGIVLDKPTSIRGNTKVSGKLTTAVQSSSYVGITTNGIIQEKGSNLSSRYSPLLKVKKFTHATGKITKGQTSKRNGEGHVYFSVKEDGWTPLGIVGYNINYNGDNHGDALFANLWECYLTSVNSVPSVGYSIYNLRNQDINVKIDVYVLYRKDL